MEGRKPTARFIKLLLLLVFLFAAADVGVAFVELLNPALGVEDLLGAGEERVAAAADIQLDFRQDGTGDKLVAADAGGGDAVVLGVNVFFHGKKGLQLMACMVSTWRRAAGI